MSGAATAQARTVATAFAPASVGNVAIGFDILGFSVDAIGDRVTARRTAAAGVTIKAIRGVVQDLPLEAANNTAGRAVIALHEAQPLGFGFELEIDKGIPLASGLGGSAASAVAAVVAANALLPQPRPQLELLRYAMQGEAVASGSMHVDNIAPSLYGGLVLTVGIDHPRVKPKTWFTQTLFNATAALRQRTGREQPADREDDSERDRALPSHWGSRRRS